MKLFTERKELQKEIRNINNISFVPTMGALHKGHVSLIKKSVNESKKTIVSIYVNPKQFESKNDYKKYPRSLKKDLDTIKKLKVNYLYKPTFFDSILLVFPCINFFAWIILEPNTCPII